MYNHVLITNHRYRRSKMVLGLPIELVVVVRIAGFDIFLSAVKYGFGSEEFGEDASDRPNVDRLRVMTGAEQKLRGAIPSKREGDHEYTILPTTSYDIQP